MNIFTRYMVETEESAIALTLMNGVCLRISQAIGKPVVLNNNRMEKIASFLLNAEREINSSAEIRDWDILQRAYRFLGKNRKWFTEALRSVFGLPEELAKQTYLSIGELIKRFYGRWGTLKGELKLGTVRQYFAEHGSEGFLLKYGEEELTILSGAYQLLAKYYEHKFFGASSPLIVTEDSILIIATHLAKDFAHDGTGIFLPLDNFTVRGAKHFVEALYNLLREFNFNAPGIEFVLSETGLPTGTFTLHIDDVCFKVPRFSGRSSSDYLPESKFLKLRMVEYEIH